MDKFMFSGPPTFYWAYAYNWMREKNQSVLMVSDTVILFIARSLGPGKQMLWVREFRLWHVRRVNKLLYGADAFASDFTVTPTQSGTV
jgi:hypothetical protein